MLIEKIRSPSGLKCVLSQLANSYAVDYSSQLDPDPTTFFNNRWDSTISVEEFFADFHARYDKITDLQFTTIVQGHTLLTQAALGSQEWNMIVGQASGSYDVRRISPSFRSACRNKLSVSATLKTHSSSQPVETTS